MFGGTKSRQYLLILLAFIYIGLNFAAWVASDPVEMGDTYRYFGFAILDPQNPGISTSLVYQSVENTNVITFIQVTIATFATLMLAWAVAQKARYNWIGIGLVVIILVVSLTTPFWSWQTLLATEGLSLSLATLWLAAVVFSLNQTNEYKYQVLALALSGSLLVITRPQFVLIVLPVTFLIAVVLRNRNSLRFTWLWTLIGVVPATAFAIWRLVQLASDKNYGYIYVMHNYLDKASTFRAYADANMPSCEPLSTAINGPAPWTDAIALRDNLIGLCPETYLWLKSGPTGFLNWTLAMPLESLTAAMSAISKMIIEPYSPMTAMPDQISQTLLPPVPSIFWIAAAWIIGIVICLPFGLRWQFSLFSVSSVLVIAASFAILTYATWASDGIELARHQAPWFLLAVQAGLVIPLATAQFTSVRHKNERSLGQQP